jgi:serine protein kinase
MDVISNFAARFERNREEELSIEDYLAECKRNPLAYATAAERMLKAIGDPTMVDTRNDPRLSRLFANKVIKIYPAFAEFYGMEDAIEQVVSYFRHAAQGLEEKKQILYLLGPVGGGKSSIAERLKQLMEHVPFYAIKGSPVNESPLGLFDPIEDGPLLEKEYGIPGRYLNRDPEPLGGEAARRVRRRHPQVQDRQAPPQRAQADRRFQDRARRREQPGHLGAGRQGRHPQARDLLAGRSRRVQLLRGPVPGQPGPARVRGDVQGADQVLHPLLTATQEGNFKGTEGFGAIPFDGIILAHSNESEWKTFRNNKNNEAFLDRIYIVKVPYCLRTSEEIKIYEKLLRNSSLAEAKCAPGTLKMMSQFAMLTRLKEPRTPRSIRRC